MQALSLVELLLVILLISVLAGLSLPRFRQVYAQVRLQQTANELSQLMRYAQGRAIARQKELQIQFDSDKKSYQLMRRIPEGVKPVEGRRHRIYFIPEEIFLEIEKEKLSFFPNGTMDRVKIFLSDQSGRTFTITTKEMRGHVHVYDSCI